MCEARRRGGKVPRTACRAAGSSCRAAMLASTHVVGQKPSAPTRPTTAESVAGEGRVRRGRQQGGES